MEKFDFLIFCCQLCIFAKRSNHLYLVNSVTKNNFKQFFLLDFPLFHLPLAKTVPKSVFFSVHLNEECVSFLSQISLHLHYFRSFPGRALHIIVCLFYVTLFVNKNVISFN